MTSKMKLTWQCMFSPRLYNIYSDGTHTDMYQPSRVESVTDKIIILVKVITKLSLYMSPFICLYIYKRNFFTIDELKTLTAIFGGIGCFVAISFLLKGYARACNPKYVGFIKDLSTPGVDKKAYIKTLRKYDFDFSAWPVTYAVTSEEKISYSQRNPFKTTANEDLPLIQRTFIQILAYLAVHSFGIWLIYPGAVFIIRNLVWDFLYKSRAQMVEQHAGERAKLQTADGNTIDTMFLDKRSTLPKGKILVISCEGNGGFYEIGSMTTAALLGYSSFGWNHPGFGSSTGCPYPSQELNAINAVMEYATIELGFNIRDIVMSGWSIGGFPATWAAVNYPVKALILDATFDDLLPLAQNHMPASWSRLVREVIRSYVDLNIAELIKSYDGPVQLIRRTEDEIICTTPGVISTNRGNYLLMTLIENRHPDLVNTVSKATMQKYVNMLEPQRSVAVMNDMDQNERALMRLISKYMRDHMSNHCSSLPDDSFQSIMNGFEGIKRE